jgi:hypothetical protein
VKVPADLSGLIGSGVLTVCDPENQQELDRFKHYATLFRSDAESMCLALAEQRGWVIATDDRRAIRVAQQARLTVVSCPQLVKAHLISASNAHTARTGLQIRAAQAGSDRRSRARE